MGGRRRMTMLGRGTINDDIQMVKAAYPLADVVERAGVRLRRVGPTILQGLCPFHAERTPSFTVYLGRQRFWCFGCRAGGDVLDFVQRHEGLRSIGEARAWLTGRPLPPRRPGAGQVEGV